MSKRMSHPATPAATMVMMVPHRLEAACAAPFLHIRSAILKTSQPRAAKPTPQKSKTDTTGFPFRFLQDAYALRCATASNKLSMSNRRGKASCATEAAFRSTPADETPRRPSQSRSKKGGPKPAISPPRSRSLCASRAACALTTPTRSWPGSWRSASSNIWSAPASSSCNARQSGVARRSGAASRGDPSADRWLPPKAAGMSCYSVGEKIVSGRTDCLVERDGFEQRPYCPGHSQRRPYRAF